MVKLKLTLLIAVAIAVATTSCVNNGVSTTTAAGADSVTKDDSATTATIQPSIRFNDTISIAMVGDVMLGSIKPNYIMPPNEGKEIFIDCASLLRDADVTCGNLEGVLADKGETRKRPGPLSFSFMMPTKSVQLLVDAGFDFMGIANNHIFDFWKAGTQSTIQTLRDAGIGVAGTADCETALRDINGVKYGFCAFGHEDYSLKTQDTTTVRRIVTSLRKQCDILIVCFHGGSEGTGARHVPHGKEYFHGMDRGDVRQFTHLCIDCGADIVYGNGPHVPRAMELYNGHLIAYSLGNFATIGMGITAQVGYAPLLVARLDGNGRFVGGKIHSFIQPGRVGPRLDSQNRAAHDIWALTQEDIKDNKLLIAPDGTITLK
jgi:hypothetical protein